MFKNLTVSIDDLAYHDETGYTTIEGWAIDPVSKNPVTVEGSVPILFNRINRPDINHGFNVSRDTEYGFLIQFPGDYRKLKPVFTFKAGDICETYDTGAFDTQLKIQPLKKFYNLLLEAGMPKLKKPWKKETPAPAAAPPQENPDDPNQEWMAHEEDKLWKEPFNETLPDFTLIINADGNPDLEATIRSAKEQIAVPEIIIATSDQTRTAEDGAVQVMTAPTTAQALERAAAAAHGTYLIFAGSGDVLSPHLINEAAWILKENPDTDFIYADEDKIDGAGKRYDLYFKPDYDDLLLRFTNYIMHPLILKKSLYEKAGGIGADGARLENYGLIARAAKNAQRVVHIPKILYHWQKSDAGLMDKLENLTDFEAGAQVLQDIFSTPQTPAVFEISEHDYAYDACYKPDVFPKVSIITGVCDGYSSAEAAKSVEKILGLTDYDDFEILAVNTEFDDSTRRVRTLQDKVSAHETELCSRAAASARGDVLLFVRPGFRPVDMAWLKEMVNLIKLPEIGIVGPKIFNNFYRIDQAGIDVADGRRRALESGSYCRSPGKHFALSAPKEVFAVSDSCMLIEKPLFERLGGFDDALGPKEADIDLCVRAAQAGKKTALQNKVSVSFDSFDNGDGENVPGLTKKYTKQQLDDPYVNANLKNGTAAVGEV